VAKQFKFKLNLQQEPIALKKFNISTSFKKIVNGQPRNIELKNTVTERGVAGETGLCKYL